MRVRIYKPSKTAMQSGRAKTHAWVLQPLPQGGRRSPDPVMGWVTGHDTSPQIKLHFETQEQAVAYAKEKGWEPIVQPDRTRTVKPKSYASNFAFVRRV